MTAVWCKPDKDLSKEVCVRKSRDILWFNCLIDKGDILIFSLASSLGVVILVLTGKGGKLLKGKLMHSYPLTGKKTEVFLLSFLID